MNALKGAPQDLKNNVAGVVFFGYTKNGQLKGAVPGFPAEKLKVFCRKDDGVCGGGLSVTAGHMGYTRDGSVEQAVSFLSQRIDTAGSGLGGAVAPGTGAAPSPGMSGMSGMSGGGSGLAGLLAGLRGSRGGASSGSSTSCAFCCILAGNSKKIRFLTKYSSRSRSRACGCPR